ncbi:MAG TPA: putative Ig domain-containing protein [Verrucomicrobiae bacterium]
MKDINTVHKQMIQNPSLRLSVFRAGILIVSLLCALLARAAAPAGQVVAWGNNTSGQTTVPSAAQAGVVKVAGGEWLTLALNNDGSVLAWGYDGTVHKRQVPAAAQSGVVAIAAGREHSVALKDNGEVVIWGQSPTIPSVPAEAQSGVIAIGAGVNHTVALKSDGSVIVWGSNTYGQSDVPLAARTGVVAIASGAYHILALKDDGSVVAWGQNLFGGVSVPASAGSRVVKIAAGLYHSLALRSDGSVIAWGSNIHGETTVPTSAQSGITDISAGQYFSMALKSNGGVIAWGDNRKGQTSVPIAAQSGVTAISAGSDHSLAILGTAVSAGPSIAITSPTTNPSYSTSGSFLNLGGAASDDVAVTEVAWVNDRGGSGLANGVSTWSISGIPLQAGVNVITVTAKDGANNRASDIITVTYTPNVERFWFDSNFNPPAVDEFIWKTALQPDGKILVGGGFSEVNGMTRSGLARINHDGSLDAAFNPSANDGVWSIAVQADGKILIGGDFTTINGTVRNHLARLNANGTLDTAFSPSLNGTVESIAVQPDGKILLGGSFTVAGASTTRNRIVRLNADGTLDASFNPNVNDTVLRMVIQPDGKILLGGTFSSVGGVTRNGIARINANGTLDTDFNPNADSAVLGLALQSNGKVVIGGAFTSVGGAACNYIARLNSNGSMDASFNANVDDWVFDVLVQPDGKILAGGDFTWAGEMERIGFARFNTDGTLDADTDIGADGTIISITLQPNDKIVIGGVFTEVDGVICNGLARLNGNGVPDSINTPVISSTSTASAIQGQSFTYQIVANNNPTSFGASGLPAGLTVNTSSGLISGTPTVTGVFTVNLSASNAGGTGTKNLVLTVNTANVSPSFSQHPANMTVTSGNTVTFTASATGTPAPIVVWQRSVDGGSSWSNMADGNGFSGSTSSTLQLTGVTMAMSGQKFRLTASNTSGSANSQAATLMVNPLVVSATAGANGSISPSGAINKDAGASQTFTATPSAGYQVDQWLVNGSVAQTGGATYTLNSIQANQTVSVSFKAVTYTVSASAGANGSISPVGAISKNAGASQTFTATPNAGYQVNQWLVNGSAVQSGGSSYTLNNIQANQTVGVTFNVVTTSYTITTAAGANGSVSPSGSVSKDSGTSQTFTATPNTGYQIDQWLVNGAVVQTGGTTFALNNIQANQAVSVSFKALNYMITASAGANGGISPAGSFSKNAGSSQTFTATAQTGYAVDQWFLNGSPVQSAGTSYTLNNIQANQTVSVSFKVVTSSGRSLKVVSTATTAGSSVVVPVQLVALGDENAIGFSLTFDPAKLSNPRISLGNGLPAGVTLNANTLQASNGKLGVALALGTGLSFGNATYTLVNITFDTATGLNGVESALTFGNQPIAREVADAAANSLPADYIGGTVTFTSGYEADVAPRPNGTGDGSLSITDWVQIGKFVAGLEVPASGSEFQRADVAPIETRGDGILKIGDWVLAGRYVAGLEPVAPAAGPTQASPELASFNLASVSSERQIHMGNLQVMGGQVFEVPVMLEALGGENAVGFSIQFDPALVTLLAVEAGSATTGAPLILNDQQKAAGKFGVLTGAAAGQGLAAGQHEIARIRFQASNSVFAKSALSFTGSPVRLDVSDANGNSLPTAYTDSQIEVVSSRLSAAAGQSAQSVKTEGYRLAVQTMAGKSYRLEWSQDLKTWNLLGTFTGTGEVIEQLDVAAKTAPQRFYRVVEN